MFSVTLAGHDGEGARKVESALRMARLRVQTLRERRAASVTRVTDGLVVVAESADRAANTGLVLDARRDDDLRGVPFCIVARWVEPRTGLALGARAVIRLDGAPHVIVDEVRRMILGARDAAAHVHQLSGDLATVALDELIDVLAHGRRDAVIHISSGVVDGAFTLREGRALEARFGNESGADAMEAMRRLRDGRFRVDLARDTMRPAAMTAPASVPPAAAPPSRRPSDPAVDAAADGDTRNPPRDPPPRDDGQRAVVAAAVMNALVAYARVHLSSPLVADAIEGARRSAAAHAPALAAFRVTPQGDVIVGRIAEAARGGGEAIGAWMREALGRLERLRPGRFTPLHFETIIGGLWFIVDRVGWRESIAAAIRGEAP